MLTIYEKKNDAESTDLNQWYKKGVICLTHKSMKCRSMLRIEMLPRPFTNRSMHDLPYRSMLMEVMQIYGSKKKIAIDL